MAANTTPQVTNLDFDTLKGSLISFLQSQSTFKDYNFEGSALNTLVDLLAYNTQYNAYYLNMVANEMFLDSAVQRSSVVSQAKVLNYTPKSAIAPTATVNVVFTNVTTNSLTLPAYQNFISSAINGVNYTFVNTDSYAANRDANNTVTFQNVVIKQGVPAAYNFTVNSSTNPTYIFEIPDATIDTTTLEVVVQESSTNSSFVVYNQATNGLEVSNTSTVYFLQEALDGNYQIYFGDGVLGNKLTDGNIVRVSYLSTEGSAAAGANSFIMMNTVSGYAPSAVKSIYPATAGGDKESIDSIKFQAPKAFASQGRAVSKNDYITVIQQNTLGYAFDAINVWGGEENNPPVYGKVFIALKPQGSYSLTDVQKQQIISNLIQPISVLTVSPTIVDPDYTYLKLNVTVYYNPSITNQTAAQIQAGVTAAIQNFGLTTLNTFNSTFSSYDLLTAIQNYDKSILSSDFKVQLQKKFYPNLNSSTTYTLDYSTPLAKGMFQSGVSSSPALQFTDPANLGNVIDGVYIEEIPQSTYGVDSVNLINPGFGYTAQPIVTILGDGTGATAHAVLTSGGTINNIVVDSSGNNYTSAIVTISPGPGDTTGQLASATVMLQGSTGTLRTYYNTNTNVKTILNGNAGTIDYAKGIVTLTNFSPLDVDNPLGQFAVAVNPNSNIINSTYNKIITIDPYDPAAISVTVVAK